MDASDRLPRHLLIGFALALGIYAVFFAFDHWTRTRKGAWKVVFTTNETGEATLVVSQGHAGITNARITLAGEHPTNAGGRVVFDRPQKAVPFGKTKFEDLTYLPGSVVLEVFGHEVELLPRTLYLNKREYAWAGGTNYVVGEGEKLKPEMSHDPREKKRSLFKR